MAAFTPKDGVAEWAKIYQLIRKGKPGELFTFDQIDKALGRDFRTNRGPMSRAIKELETVENLTAVPVRGEGYRIIATGQDFITVGEARHRRSRKALVRAADVAQAGIRSDLPTAEERGNLMLVSARVARLVQLMGRKLVEHEEKIQEHAAIASDHEERLRRLESGKRL